MDQTQDTLEARCQQIWVRMSRPYAAYLAARRKRKNKDARKADVPTKRPKYKAYVTDDDSDSSESDESPDISIWVYNEFDTIDSTSIALIKHAADAPSSLEPMDASIGRLLNIRIPSWHKSDSQAIRRAVKIINRLPESSLPLSSELWSTLHDASPSGLTKKSHTSCWEKQKVTTMVDSCTIRLALLTAYLGQTTHPEVRDALAEYSDILSTILDKITALEGVPGALDPLVHRQSCEVAKAFVWTAWQRCLQVSAYYTFGTRLRRECNAARYINLPKSYEELPFGVTGNFHKTIQETDWACNYMCRHPFDLLKLSTPGSQDFRTLVLRYNNQFGDRGARCYTKGLTWHHCESTRAFCPRCIKSETEDQSAHDQNCAGNCQRILWDQDSYTSIAAPRCVQLSLRQPQKALQYRTTTDQTLAISHVWSHGQGGRPEDGFNECLHNRYSALATYFGCDSYWIDAACIPSDEHLRAEAIKTINPTFRNSKVTLICDKDLMSVAAGELNRPQCETLISTLLLSDWNLRAWTLLEGIRGNKGLYLLCKDNNPVRLTDLLSALYEKGSIDLCGLLVGSPHLLPMGEAIQAVGLEAAGVMLSRRFASRRGDDIIIWSLLCGEDDLAQSRAELFWTNRVNTYIRSGFLMSTCQRVKGTPGLSWAPSTPFANPLAANFDSEDESASSGVTIYNSSDSTTFNLRFYHFHAAKNCRTPLQLVGDWFVYIVRQSDLDRYADADATSPNSCFAHARQITLSREYKRVIFIRPALSRLGTGTAGEPFTSPRHLDAGKEAPVAICATKDDYEMLGLASVPFLEIPDGWAWPEQWEWEWKGVWPLIPNESIDMAAFKIRALRLI